MSINGSISNLILETWKNNNLKAATTTVVSSYRNQNVPKLRILHWPSQMASTSIQEPSRTTWNAMERLSTRKNASFYWDHFSAWRIGRTDWSAWVDVVWQLLCAIWRQILECSWLLLASSAEQRHRTAILILYLWDSWHCKLRANIFAHTHTHCIFLYTVNFFSWDRSSRQECFSPKSPQNRSRQSLHSFHDTSPTSPREERDEAPFHSFLHRFDDELRENASTIDGRNGRIGRNGRKSRPKTASLCRNEGNEKVLVQGKAAAAPRSESEHGRRCSDSRTPKDPDGTPLSPWRTLRSSSCLSGWEPWKFAKHVFR